MARADRVEVRLDLDELFRQMNESVQLQASVRKRATSIAARARRIDASENSGTASITLTEHWMPNGRFVMHVNSDDVEGEFGTSKTARRRTLRRAMGKR
ncbi:hypothetical protein L5I01_17490 [Gordonia sp. HY442]|uniref:hypothetical protein n=1 Tax=Gordonia zhenghanii TaxID=2911516 RepID=UPI001F19464A|nr:hypothetical protein [Gordonia zhenghanii]MCF8605151.1 hypothetical protein [Gordonia zhenghanii]